MTANSIPATRLRLILLAALAASAGCLRSGEAQQSAPSVKNAYRGRLLATTGDNDFPVKVWDADGKPVLDPYYFLARKGLTLLGRNYSLRLEGGCFYSGGAEDYLGAGLKGSGGELSLAAHICPAAVSQEGAGWIIGYGPAKGQPLFALTQEKDALTFSIAAAGAQKIGLLRLKAAEPFHLVLAVGRKELALYRNGEKLTTWPGIKGDFSAWENGMLFLGNDRTGAHPWRGRLDGVALYNKALGPAEAKEAAGALLEELRGRQAVPTLEFEGTLLARSKYPMPWDPSFTYREVLAVCEYRVNKVIRGEYQGEKIRVAEWMYEDQIFLTNSRRPIGTRHRLVVEQMNANPHLSTVQRSNTLELDMDAEIYYDLSPIEALPKDQQPKPPKKEQPSKAEREEREK